MQAVHWPMIAPEYPKLQRHAVIADEPVPDTEFDGHMPLQVSMLVAAVDIENLPAGQFWQSEYAPNLRSVFWIDVVEKHFSCHAPLVWLGT